MQTVTKTDPGLYELCWCQENPDTGQACWLGPPVVPFYYFLKEGSPTKIDYRKRTKQRTLTLTSLLEDLVGVLNVGRVFGVVLLHLALEYATCRINESKDCLRTDLRLLRKSASAKNNPGGLRGMQGYSEDRSFSIHFVPVAQRIPPFFLFLGEGLPFKLN